MFKDFLSDNCFFVVLSIILKDCIGNEWMPSNMSAAKPVTQKVASENAKEAIQENVQALLQSAKEKMK